MIANNRIADNRPNKLGESPIWNYFNNKLYWVDIEGYQIKSLDGHFTGQGKGETFQTEKKPTSLSLIDGTKMFVSMEDSLGIYDFRMNQYHIQKKLEDKNVRFNDGKCDKDGILHIGTMSLNNTQNACIYKYQNNELIKIKDNLGIANGIAFEKQIGDQKTMYFCDSKNKLLWRREQQEDTIINRFDSPADFARSEVTPDGGTVDLFYAYYSCMWGGYGINVYMDDVWAPNYRQVGAPMKINRFIKLPCKYTTCCCFGGQDLDLLFVTSAYNNSSDNGRLLVLDQDSQDTLNHVVGRGIKEEPIKL
tara:strand:- start:15916 stop:16833 length:918 start_codon:yes stop_codon:yes gene_type:complete